MSKPSTAETNAIITAHPLFELEDVVIKGVTHKCWKNNPTDYRSFLIPRLEKWADRPFMDAPIPEPGPKEIRQSITFGELLKHGYVLAAWLREQGVGVESKVGLAGFNSINWAITWIAIHLVGAVPVMINAALTLDSMSHCLKITHPKVVICDANVANLLAPAADKLKALGVGNIYSFHPMDHLPNRVPVIDPMNLKVSKATLDGVIAGKGLQGLVPDSDGTVFFTSGTTGYPKAVLSSQRAGLHNLLASYVPTLRAVLRMGVPIEQALPLLMGNDDPPVKLLAIPLFHATGCYGQMVRGINDGSKVVLMRRWDIPDAVKLMVEHKVNIIGGVPSIPTAILQSGLLPKDFQLRGLSYGGAAPQKRLAGDLAQRWPTALAAVGWGMTETNAIHCMHAGPDYVARPTSCGPCVPTVHVKVVDPETKKPVPVNTHGLVLAKGPNIMKEYYGNPKATNETLDADGWLDTGDGGYLDEDNNLYIVDRIKDIIIRGGENIPSTEVENAVFTDSRIAEAAAVPVPDDVLGELVAVAVSLAPGAKATGDELVALISPKLRQPARPVFIWVSDTPLDRNANGKIVKKDIKAKVHAAYKRRQGKL